MIEVKNVVKSFDGFRALDGLTMTVPHGAVYGLVGPNGAGKSTIIRHLAGIYRQDSGDVLVDGQPVYENTAVKRRMAVIGDDWYYFPQSGIREMAKFYAGLYPAFSWERYQKLKEVFPLQREHLLQLLVALPAEGGIQPCIELRHLPDAALGEVVPVVADDGHAPLHSGVLIHRLAVHQHVAAVLPVDARQMADDGGLARAVGPHQTVHRAVGHRHGQAVQRPEAVKALDDIFYLDHTSSPPSHSASSCSRVQPRLFSSSTSGRSCCVSSAMRRACSPSPAETKLPLPATE